MKRREAGRHYHCGLDKLDVIMMWYNPAALWCTALMGTSGTFGSLRLERVAKLARNHKAWGKVVRCQEGF